MKIFSIFNNKGGVGKTTLLYHLGAILGEMGKKTLLIDMDPQCNLSLYALTPEQMEDVWQQEDEFLEDYDSAMAKRGAKSRLKALMSSVRSVHFHTKPVEDGRDEYSELPKSQDLGRNLSIIPGRLSLYQFELKIAERWTGAYQGDPLALRTILKVREIAEKYIEKENFDFVVIDTSPSLGVMNKVIISTVDAFLIPSQPDMFSLYGIRNIGNSLSQWQKDLRIVHGLLSDEKRSKFPDNFVQCLGYCIYNAKKYAGRNKWDLSAAAFSYAEKIPDTIKNYLPVDVVLGGKFDSIVRPIGGKNIMHTHNTFPSVAQLFKKPMWRVPDSIDNPPADVSKEVVGSIKANADKYKATRKYYEKFATDLLRRM